MLVEVEVEVEVEEEVEVLEPPEIQVPSSFCTSRQRPSQRAFSVAGEGMVCDCAYQAKR